MDRMIYLSMTGAKATMQRQEIVANNLANASTQGFRADLTAFRAVPVLGDGASTRVYALESTPAYNDEPGQVQPTGRGLDVAMRGKAWLAVQGTDGADATTRFWSPGPGTARVLAHVLQTLGLPADRIDSPPTDAAQFDSEHLWPVVRSQVGPGKRILVVRGRSDGQADAPEGGLAGHGRDWLIARCREAGALVDVCVAYERRPAVFDTPALQRLRSLSAPGSVWLLSASEAVAALPGLATGIDWSGACAVVTHPRIAEAAQVHGFGRVVQARPVLPEVLRVLESLAEPS